jgi:hypothetical protein
MVVESEKGRAEERLRWHESKMQETRAEAAHTETKVAGRNVIVKSAIDFTTALSCRAIMLYAYYTGELLLLLLLL